MKRNQRGFGAVEGLLILVIVGLIGFIGWYVYHAMKRTNNTYNTTTTSTSNLPKFSTKAKTSKTTDITADWATIKSPDGSFSFKAPMTWVSLTCDKSGGSASTVYIASGQSYLAACQSDNSGEADLSMRAGNSAATAPQKQSTDQSLSSESFTLNGVKAYKTTEMTNADDVFLPNAKIITYSFYSGGKSFYASYRQANNGKDDTATFEQIVQTWKF
jgi:cytoskeletal protein RodZ